MPQNTELTFNTLKEALREDLRVKLKNTASLLDVRRLSTMSLNMKFETTFKSQRTLNEDILIPIPRFPIITMDLQDTRMKEIANAKKRSVPLLNSEIGFTKLSLCMPSGFCDHKEGSIFN